MAARQSFKSYVMGFQHLGSGGPTGSRYVDADSITNYLNQAHVWNLVGRLNMIHPDVKQEDLWWRQSSLRRCGLIARSDIAFDYV